MTHGPTGQLAMDEGIRLGVTVTPAFFMNVQPSVGTSGPTALS